MEANKGKYFVDGFLIKNFDIWPSGVDKDNLLEDQKVFLVYLMGVIPTSENWNLNVEYQTRLDEIKSIKMKDILLSDTDVDLAKMQNKDIDEIKRERLKIEKNRKIEELNKKFGVKQEKEIEEIEGLPESTEDMEKNRHEELWDMLQGKAFKK